MPPAIPRRSSLRALDRVDTVARRPRFHTRMMAPIAADSSTIDVTAKPNKVAKKTEGPILASDGLSLNLIRTHVRTPWMSGERRLHASPGAARARCAGDW